MATHHGMIYHICHNHKAKSGLYQCIFNEDCELFPDVESVAEHIFAHHFDLLPLVLTPFFFLVSISIHFDNFCDSCRTKVCLTCQTCETVFQSSVQFGKHMCLMLQTIDEGEENFQCLACDKKLTSRKRLVLDYFITLFCDTFYM